LHKSSIDITKKLIGFDTTSHRSNLPLIEYVEDYLASYGVTSTRIYNERCDKANLWASIGPNNKSDGLVFAGHTDVVPVDGQNWSNDPFSPLEKDDKLFGRGTADMKGFIGNVLAMMPILVKRNLNIPIHFAFTYDEEVDLSGAYRLSEYLREDQITPRWAVIGEPTSMQVVSAHKGSITCETKITGPGGHASLADKRVNPVVAAAQMIHAMQEIPQLIASDEDTDFEPSNATFNVGVIDGGAASNIIPTECSFVWEYRLLPGQTQETIMQHYREIESKSDQRALISTESGPYFPPFMSSDTGDFTSIVKRLLNVDNTIAVPFGTEAAVFQEAGMSVLVCGPGSIEQAHQPDEFIELDQLAACGDFLMCLADEFSD